MTFGYGVALLLIAAGVLILSLFAVRTFDRAPVQHDNRLWWMSWQRTALLLMLCLFWGAIGSYSGDNIHGMTPVFLLLYILLLVVYSEIGIRVRRFRVELLLAWSVWVAGTVGLGTDVREATQLALMGWVPCVTFGAVITKLGVRRAWRYRDIWQAQTNEAAAQS